MDAEATGSLAGRVCVVTGAGRSIGLGIAEHLHRCGAKVALVDRDGEAVRRQAVRLDPTGQQAMGVTVDITDREAVMAGFDRIREQLGPVGVLVNNAGIVDQRPFEQITPDQMDQMMRVNVHGTLYCCQAAAPDMKPRRFGRIINFSSKSGKTGSALMAHYSAAKGAIIALTHALAFELAEHDITVNCLCPGITESTGVWDSVSAGYIENLHMPRQQVVDKFTAKIPLGRLARIDDIVRFVHFLATSADYCTGQAFNITGGRVMH